VPISSGCAYDARRSHLAPAPVLASVDVQPLEAVKELHRVVSIARFIQMTAFIGLSLAGGLDGYSWLVRLVGG